MVVQVGRNIQLLELGAYRGWELENIEDMILKKMFEFTE